MKNLTQRLGVSAVLGFTLLCGQPMAVETATVGSRTNQANVDVLNSKIDSLMAAQQAVIDGMKNCNVQRKFYSPTDPKKDASGCVGIQDYNLSMTTGTAMSVNTGGTAYGLTAEGGNNIGVIAHSTNQQGIYGSSDTNWAGYFSGGANGYGVQGISTAHEGVYGLSTNYIGVRGSSTNNWAAYFAGAYGAYGNSSIAGGYGLYGAATGSGGYGVYGNSTVGYGVYGSSGSSWSGVFAGGPYGVYGSGTAYAGYFDGNVYIGAGKQLCIGTSCVTSFASAGGHEWGGMFETQWMTNGAYPMCSGPNIYVGSDMGWPGSCSCPAGFTTYGGADFITGNYDHRHYWCAK